MRSAVCIMILALAVGCSDTEKETAAPVTAPPSVAVNAAPVPSSVSVAPPAPTSPPPALPAPGVAAPAVSSAQERNGQVFVTDDSGQVLQGEAFLKKAIMQHVEGLGNPYPVRIEELVEKGTLKTLPPAPNGQHWAIDPKTKQVILQ